MTDQLVQQLTRELGLRATDMSGDPTLAPRVLQRAGVVRRRRTVGLSLTAAVAVAAVAFATTGPALRLGSGPTPPPATRSGTTDRSIPAPTDAAPTIGYVVNGGPAQTKLTTRTVVHLGGASIPLPRGWWVQRMIASGPGLLLDAVLPDGGQHSVYVGPDGSITPLPSVAPGPMAMNREGTVLLDTLAVQISGQLKTVAVPSGRTVGAVEGPAAGSSGPLGVVGPRSVVLFDSTQKLTVWTMPASGNGPATSVALPVSPAGGRVTDTDLSGSMVEETPGGIVLLGPDGKPRWTYAPASPERLQYMPHFSADGSRVAAVFDHRLLLLPVGSGRPVVQSDPLPAAVAFGDLFWEDHDTVLVDLRTSDSHPDQVSLVRCSAVSLKCTVVTTKGYLVLPSS